MRLTKEKPKRENVDESVAVANSIFERIKLIPGGAVGRKIAEIGEERVRDYWLRMRFHKTGDPRYGLPSKGIRRHFWRPAIQPKDTLMQLRATAEDPN